MVERHDWIENHSEDEVAFRLAERLGLSGRGHHFYCPGCQSEAAKGPEMLIKDGHFQCFRCGAAGDLVGLVKLVHNCDDDEALSWLEDEL